MRSYTSRPWHSLTIHSCHFTTVCVTGRRGGFNPIPPTGVLFTVRLSYCQLIDGLVPSSPLLEALDSSHSTPPKMVLQYNDTRPNIPIASQSRPLSTTSSLRHRPVAPDVPFILPSHLQTQSLYLGQGLQRPRRKFLLHNNYMM